MVKTRLSDLVGLLRLMTGDTGIRKRKHIKAPMLSKYMDIVADAKNNKCKFYKPSL